MAENYFLVIDAGTGGGRCLIFDDLGKLHALAYEEWSFSSNWYTFGALLAHCHSRSVAP